MVSLLIVAMAQCRGFPRITEPKPNISGLFHVKTGRFRVKITSNKRKVTEMKKITLYIGLNDRETKTQLISTLDAYRLVNNILSTDSTITECKGVYTHDDGSITTENTLEVVLLDFDGSLNMGWVKSKATAIKLALNQEAIAYQEEEIKSELI